MRTIHVNKKAAAIAIGSLFFTGLILLYSFSTRHRSGLSTGHRTLLSRDINNRIKLSLERLDETEVILFFLALSLISHCLAEIHAFFKFFLKSLKSP